MNNQQRRAKVFNEDADLYEKIRPGYPKEVFTDLQNYTNLNSNSNILEIGCGTGQATHDLLMISNHITCVEPGKDLLQIARRKFPELSFINSKFEDLKTNKLFDVIFAATSWHWVDPHVGYEKAYKLLQNTGYLAILRNYHLETDPKAFHMQTRNIYNKYSNRTVVDLSSRKMIEEQANSIENEYFHIIKQTEHSWQQTYTINEYIALRNTYSDHRLMKESERQKFEQELKEVANKEFKGLVTKNYIAVLFIADKKPS